MCSNPLWKVLHFGRTSLSLPHHPIPIGSFHWAPDVEQELREFLGHGWSSHLEPDRMEPIWSHHFAAVVADQIWKVRIYLIGNNSDVIIVMGIETWMLWDDMGLQIDYKQILKQSEKNVPITQHLRFLFPSPGIETVQPLAKPNSPWPSRWIEGGSPANIIGC